MKYRTGKDEKSAVRVYKHLPKGWKVREGASTQPPGTVWAFNGKSIFSPEYKQALVVRDEKRMVERIADNRRLGREDRFIADQTTEKKIWAEMRRQERERKKRESLNKTRSAAAGKPSSAKKPAKNPATPRSRKK